MIISDLDLGGRPAPLVPRLGLVLGSAAILGSRTVVWPQGGDLSKLDVAFWITAWRGAGGQPANSLQANRYLRTQLKQLSLNPDLQPVYIQWAASADPTFSSRTDPDDGWYLIDTVSWDPETWNLSGSIEARMTVTQVAPAAPSSFAVRYDGAAVSTSYSAAGVPLLAFPVGSTGQAPTAASRTGGEGAIPISTSPVPNPVPFVRPATIAGLFTGGCRVWDTINTGSNPVPVAGGVYVNANWVEVKGPLHDFVGDCVVTNGLLLLLYQAGGSSFNVPRVYLWNTSLGTPTWQLIGDLKYNDNAGNGGAVREINLERLGLQEVRVRITAQTSAGNWAMFKQRIQAGCYHVFSEFWPLTENETSQTNFMWDVSGGIGSYATGFTDSASGSASIPQNLAATSVSGYAAGQGSAAGSPIFGILYQSAPTTAQGRLVSTSQFASGDTAGPAAGSYKPYGFFAVPYSGTVVLATAQGIAAALFQQWKFDRNARWVRG